LGQGDEEIGITQGRGANKTLAHSRQPEFRRNVRVLAEGPGNREVRTKAVCGGKKERTSEDDLGTRNEEETRAHANE